MLILLLLINPKSVVGMHCRHSHWVKKEVLSIWRATSGNIIVAA